MGWEIRCFYPLPIRSTSTSTSVSASSASLEEVISTSGLDKHLLLCAFATKQTLFESALAERRSDEYIDLHHGGFGLKFRGGRQLELKTRTKQVEVHGLSVENWNKAVLSVSSKSISDVFKSVEKVSKTAAHYLPTIEVEHVTVKKARVQSFGSVVSEVADLEVFPSSSSGSPHSQWRTICFEGSNSENLAKHMREFITLYHTITSEDDSSLRVMGYPEFISTFTAWK